MTHQQLTDAQRERDALRVAYEAQQLRLKELSERVVALEDRVMLDRAPGRSGRGAGLWGRPLRGEADRSLPVVKLSALQPRRAERRALAEPPSVQQMREERLERLGQGAEEEVPTLTAQNVSLFKRKRPKKRRAQQPYPAPEGSAQASSLGVVPVPPSPKGQRPSQPAPLVAPAAPASAPLQPSPAPLAPRDPFDELLKEARVALKGGDWTEAKRGYEQVLSLSPKASDRSKARLGLARVLQGQGRSRDAIEALRALIQDDPSGALVPSALLEIGQLQLNSGQSAQGRATLTRLKSLYPNTAAARRAEGLLP